VLSLARGALKKACTFHQKLKGIQYGAHIAHFGWNIIAQRHQIWKNSYNGEMGEQQINYSMHKIPKFSPKKRFVIII
jgi:hypothetical protein